MKHFKALALSLLICGLAGSGLVGQDEESPWIVDNYDEALSLAGMTGKDMLVDFSGTDWCVWCQRLHKEVFDKDEFIEAVKDRFILCLLQFPQKKKPKAQNIKLSKQFDVKGYPTVILMDKNGKPYASAGYQKGGVAPYLKLLDNLKTNYGVIKKEVDKTLALEGEEQIKATLGLFDFFEGLKDKKLDFKYHYLRAFPEVIDLFIKSLTLDKDNKAGLKMKCAVFLMENEAGGDEVIAAIKELDKNNEQGYLERVFVNEFNGMLNAKKFEDAIKSYENFIKDKKIKSPGLQARIVFIIGQVLRIEVKDNERAKKYYQSALDAATDERMKTAIQKILDEMK